MDAKKTGKIVLSLVTIGVTATAVYYGYKAFKKHAAKKKAALEANDKAAKEKETPAPAKSTAPAANERVTQ